MQIEVTDKFDDNSDRISGNLNRPADDELGIRTSAELLEAQADTDSSSADEDRLDATQDVPTNKPNSKSKLTADQIKSIEKNLYGSAAYVSDRERERLLQKVAETRKPSSNQNLDAMANDLPRPAMAKRGRGVAYFVKNFVQLQGEVTLHEDDELLINDRAFVLRKKPLTPRTVITVGAVAFVLIAFIFIPILVRDAGIAKGEIIGVVLDANHQPVLVGASVKLPEWGKTYQANAQGFFKTGHIPPGTHKLEYIVDGRVVATDYATVAAGDVTTVTLLPSSGEIAHQQASLEREIVADESNNSDVPAAAPEEVSRPMEPAPKQSKPAPSGYGNITLAANIQDARFLVDGGVLGAGNLTYRDIKAGTRKYTVSRDGYQPVSGTLTISPGKTEVLTVALVPLTQTQPLRQHDNAYEAATELLQSGDLTGAIGAFDAIISSQPSHAEAYLGRAEAYSKGRNRSAAHDDYLRAAEILRLRNENGEALRAFNNAVKMDEKSIAAYLGRANLYLARNEAIAAIADYETAVTLDKKNGSAHLGLGEARFSQGNYGLAIKHFKDAKSLEPNNPVIYQYLMLCYMGDDDLKNVKKSYDRFKEIATQEQMARLHSDNTYAAVLRLVETEN